MEGIKIKNLYNIEKTIAKEKLNEEIYPWEIIPKIKDIIIDLGEKLDLEKYEKKGENIWIAKTAQIAPTVVIEGPAIIDENAEIRQFAYIRENVIVGKNAVVGHSVEIKNSILFNETQVAHFNYVGDSILGYKVHLGAGSIISNLKGNKDEIYIKLDNGEKIETKLKKLGAMLGDYVEIGSNVVLNPGAIIGKKTNVYPLNSVRGIIKENHIYKDENNIIEKY